MSPEATKLLDMVLALPAEEREHFADLVYESLAEDSPEEIEASWVAEVDRRVKEVEEGKAHMIPWDDVLADLRKRFVR